MLSSVLTRSPNALRRQITQTRGIWTRLSPSARSTPSMKRPPAQGWRQNSSYRARNNMGVFTPKSAAVFIAAGVGLFFYFRYEKERLLEEREKERQSKAYGRPKLGGPFTLTTHDGKTFTEQDMKGKWSLVYFGFTNCPDICPAELDKITDVLNVVQKDHGDIFLPLFVTVDPARDLPHRIGRYLGDFHPSFIGLYGDYDATKAVCKKYRVYFSTPPNADPNGDYLVDHSIFVYLMDPDGKFVEAFGQVVTGEEFIEKIGKSISEYEQETGRKA
ncbi:h-sco1 [Coprinopsis sp. MPI-PUGE-AT-0042]|nr:h-sco1 [Coprinopsis sp. MPI-PUGE-AT-0042]